MENKFCFGEILVFFIFLTARWKRSWKGFMISFLMWGFVITLCPSSSVNLNISICFSQTTGTIGTKLNVTWEATCVIELFHVRNIPYMVLFVCFCWFVLFFVVLFLVCRLEIQNGCHWKFYYRILWEIEIVNSLKNYKFDWPQTVHK